MTDVDDQGRPEPPLAGDEVSTIVGFLEFQRATLGWKTDGLDADGMRFRTAASTMTLGGILKHMALVEDLWCSRRLFGRDPVAPWDSVDWDADRDWEWTSSLEDSPEALRNLWYDAVGRSRRDVAEAVAAGGLDRRAAWAGRGSEEAPSLRWILVHLIEEYARHNGHADILREAVDGQTGE
jgi:uncharacterized damage-inducible protein DinB